MCPAIERVHPALLVMLVSILAKGRVKRKEKVIRFCAESLAKKRCQTLVQSSPMTVTIVTTMRNEGAHLLEWIAHHRAAGVTGFLVYVNDCEDGTEALLRLLPGVEVIELPAGDKPPQWRALKAAWDHPMVAGSDWLACIDCDEFINLGNGLGGVPDLVEAAGGDAIMLPWRLYGHSGQVALSDAPTCARFARCAAPDMLYPAIGSYFKTLFRRAGPFRQFGVHRPKQKNPERHGLPDWRDGSGHAVSGKLPADDGQIMHWGAPIARDLAQLNHYSVRSAADFLIKQERGLPNHQSKRVDLTYWVERNFNTVEDRSIEAMGAGTAEVLAEFMTIDGVAEAQAACRDWRRARFDALMRTPEGLKLYGRLLLAGSSEALPQDAALGLIKAYGEVHSGE